MGIKIGDIFIFRGTGNTTRPLPICHADSCFKVTNMFTITLEHWLAKEANYDEKTVELTGGHFRGYEIFLELLTDKKHTISRPSELLLSNWWHEVTPEQLESAKLLYA